MSASTVRYDLRMSTRPHARARFDVEQEARRRFSQRYGREPIWVAAAPGRVNLIGDHTDYNGGFVLPMAIDRFTAIAAAPTSGTGRAGMTRIASGLIEGALEFRVGEGRPPMLPAWSRSVFGVIELAAQTGRALSDLDAWIESTVPIGAGLASSAALEVATATLVEAVTLRPFELLEKAELCQRAEQRYAGVPCGIMDQFTCAAGRLGCALLLDCRSLEDRWIPFDDPDVSVLIVDSGIRHDLADGAYARMRAECSAAARALGVRELREVTISHLDAAQEQLGEVEYRRAHHVVGEIERTRAAFEALAKCAWPRFGALMDASHDSLRDNAEVSCPELDTLVEIGRDIGEPRGVYGSRMTGGGFGGCTVHLIKSHRTEEIVEIIRRRYREVTGREPMPFVTPDTIG